MYNPTTGSSNLTAMAHKSLVTSLQRFGNTLSPQHEQALFALVDSFTRMASGDLKGRWAFGLPTGSGKTRAIIEWATAVHKTPELPYTVAIAASRIEALCTLKRDMIDNGIPEDKIGLLHDDRNASLRATADNDDRPFMLCTHQRIRSKKDNLSLYNLYKGQPRHLLIYDESLMSSDVQHFDFIDLCACLAHAIERTKRDSQHAEIYAYLVEAKQIIEAMFDRYDTQHDHLICTPAIASKIAEHYAKEWEREGTISHFLQAANLDLRMVRDGASAVVGYRVAVPAELGNIIALDASFPIRDLCLLDATVQNAEKLPSVRRLGLASFHDLKRFDDVTLHRLRSFGGRYSIEKRFKDKSMAKECVEVLKTIPENEAALFYLYKLNQPGGTDYRKILEREISKAGIELDATVTVTMPDGTTEARPRIIISTWGNETSLNCYAYCKHVFLVGILHQDSTRLMGAFLAAVNDLSEHVDKQIANDLQLSEKAHLAYQALSRGTCRTVVNGKALPMNGYMVEIDPVIETTLEQVMPGVTWKKWKPYFVPEHEGLIETWVKTVQDYLNGLEEDSISSQALRKKLKAEKVAPSTWKRVIQTVSGNISTAPKKIMGDGLSFRWKLEGRTLIRQTAEHLGFTEEVA